MFVRIGKTKEEKQQKYCWNAMRGKDGNIKALDR